MTDSPQPGTGPGLPGDRFAGLPAATVHEAAGGRGALPSAIKPIAPGMRVCGSALTVDCPPADNLWLHRAVYIASPGDVLVADVRGHTEAGYWGEILSRAAFARGLGGLVITGGVRDIEEIARLGFPVFALAVCLRGTAKDPNGDGSVGEPLRIGEVTVRRGDLVLGDADGVVVVAGDESETVAESARRRMTAEQAMLERLGRGESTLEILGLPA